MNNIEIENLFDYKIVKQNQKYLLHITMNNINVTELRVLHSFNELDNILKYFKVNDMKPLFFIFNLKKVTLNTPILKVDELSKVFTKYMDFFLTNLELTILYTDSVVVKYIMKCVKQYYTSTRPVYLCKNEKEIQNCIYDESSRKKLLSL